MNLLPKQCKKHSKPVEKSQHKEVMELAEKMVEICNQPIGKYPNAIALAHCQVDHDNPLRFFVFIRGRVIINPKIIEKSDPINHLEGCFSYPFREMKKVQRYNRITVEYINQKWKEEREEIVGIEAAVFQHEIDHFNRKAIY